MPLHAASPAASRGWFSPGGNGDYSQAANNICNAAPSSSSAFVFAAPNRNGAIRMRLTPDGGPLLFTVDASGRERVIDTAAWRCPEIGWSAASDRFFVTYSDGGQVGTYQVSAYRSAAGRWQPMDVTADVRRDFLRGYPRCFDPEDPNLAGVAWSSDGKRLLVAAQVLPHSNCDDMGTFKLYEVTVPGGKILRRFSQREAKAAFTHLLGGALRAADDACDAHPGACAIPMLHRRDSD